MDFEITAEQKLFRDSVRRFAERHLRDGALRRARAGGYPWDVARLMAEHHLLGITIGRDDGGQGGSLMDAVLAIEQVALICPRGSDVVQAGSFGPIRTFAEYASAEQKARYLPALLAGDGLIAIAMTEPDAGSAVTDLATTATTDGDGFRINGAKLFTSYSTEATLFLAYVRYGPGVDGIGSVIVERDAPGLRYGEPSRFMSGETWRPLFFDDCYVGPENVLLRAGGFKKQIAGFNAERIGSSARSLAFGRHAFNLAREHALVRRQFGRPLCEFQGLQWKFADMAMRLEAAQLILYRAAVNADHGLPSAYETALAKAHCATAGFEVANEAMQVMGASGYTEDSLVDYCMRRTRGWLLAGGSLEMMKNQIAAAVFDRRFPQRPPKPQ